MDSSRIFVRGLPPALAEDDVRKHFSKFAAPTDIKCFPHRRIGYIGYKTPEDAAKAIKYFNKTFIRMSKIYVEPARSFSDKELPKSRRQQKEDIYSRQKQDEYVPPLQDNALKRKRPTEDDAEHDPKLKEFLEVMQPPSKTKVWANGETSLDSSADAMANTKADTVDTVVPDGESDDEYQVIAKRPKAEISTRDSSKEHAPVEEPVTRRVEDDADVPDTEVTEPEHQEQDAATTGLVSDADWLRSRTNRVLDLVEDDGNESLQSTRDPASDSKKDQDKGNEDVVEAGYPGSPMAEPTDEQEESKVPSSEEEKVRRSGRLYLRNLHWEVTSDALEEHFSQYGAIEEVHVSMDKKTGRSKGFAFLEFKDPEHAVEAFTNNDGTIFQGRLLHVLAAESKRDNKLDEFAISKLPLKKQREIRRKAEAGAGFNWNSLYFSADAIMNVVANRLGVNKADVLDPTSSDAAVKQAQAETHIIHEIKSYFAKHGVDLESFKRSSRGDIAILVKNIPTAATPDEVRALMEEHGRITRFLMPPAGMTAIVEFSNATEAKSAFASLSYRKFKDSILYLEKAPKALFKDGVSVPEAPTVSTSTDGAKLSATDLLQDAPAPESSDTTTLYVRNLNFSTTTQRLNETFSPLEGFRSAVVKTKNDPKRGVLSMGFGFVSFNSAATASAALRAMDGYKLDGHDLQIKASHKGADAAEERRKEDVSKKAAGTKIIIKNLPFEANKKDVRALFSPYGSLVSVRVPKKFQGSSRGFAFAHFVSQRDAANALEALRNTHLLGRRLVLDYAETEANDPELELEKMQQKVGAQANKVALQRLTGGGRKKFNVAGNDDLDDA
ncbi:hypothetical protein B0J11DRAFT_574480 [Dendryphion nanum]|uniref:Multiple RNA-binding domain-containing protein 1 n=1 Tax=Dendryphion nanum TaxID=256645 RepID=A0A9P9EKG6_9PLEO|nr:hypothetical protein B0J11DRAFT_574480 [Dendryphion nanum]